MVEVQRPTIKDISDFGKIEMLSLSPNERLDLIIQVESGSYSTDSIGRVKSFIDYETSHPDRKKPFKRLIEVDDFLLYYRTKPEWSGKSVADMLRDKESGAAAFYQAFYRRVRIATDGNVSEQNRLIEGLFPQYNRKWVHLKSFDDWATELYKHPEWKYRKPSQMLNNHDSGASGFYQALRSWAEKESKGDRKKRRQLIGELFKYGVFRWNHLKTLEDWKNEFTSHPQWQGKSSAEMEADRDSGAASYYQSFLIWSKKEITDPQNRKAILNELFPRKITRRKIVKNPKRVIFDRAKYTSIEDWELEYHKHPEWQGKSTKEMQEDLNSGAAVFYRNFIIWTKEVTQEDQDKRNELIETIFPRKYTDRSNYTFQEWQNEFSQHPEWRGRSPSEMLKDAESGAAAFYRAFYEWTVKKSEGDNKLSREYTGKLFQYTARKYEAFDEWESEFNAHPEWHGKKPYEMLKDVESGAAAFYRAYYRWIVKEAKGDKVKLRELQKRLFTSEKIEKRAAKEVHLQVISADEAEEDILKLL